MASPSSAPGTDVRPEAAPLSLMAATDLPSTRAARPFAGAVDSWTYAPLDETTRAAHEVLARLAAR